MATIYGKTSKYLTKQRKRYTRFESALIYNAITVGVICVFLFLYGYIMGRSGMMKIIFTLLLMIVVILYLLARGNRQKAGYYQQGQCGEKQVLEELMKLPQNYAVFYDLKFKNTKANIDFLVTGPTGVFAIEVKSREGYITQNNVKEEVIMQTLNGALNIKKYLEKRSVKTGYIDPLLVYSSNKAMVRTFQTDHHVRAMQKNYLNKYILSQKDITKEINIFELEKFLVALTAHNYL